MQNSEFVANLHKTSKVVSYGSFTTELEQETFPAVLVQNLYGQQLVWGTFGRAPGRKGKAGKLNGKLANSAGIEGVYRSSEA